MVSAPDDGLGTIVHIDNYSTTYLGNNTVSASVAASGLHDLKGRGSLTDFRVAPTLDGRRRKIRNTP